MLGPVIGAVSVRERVIESLKPFESSTSNSRVYVPGPL
jgi:hypothetical protein